MVPYPGGDLHIPLYRCRLFHDLDHCKLSSSMGGHDDYGKRVLREAAGDAYEMYGSPVEVDYGAGQPARIDGAVGGNIAVEVESRTSKQIRGAVLDLICHRFPKKLLILLPVHMSNPTIAAEQCRVALAKFVAPGDFEVVVLAGHGDDPRLEEDALSTRAALMKLGFNAAA